MGAEHAVAVGLKLALVRLNEHGERVLIAAAGCVQQLRRARALGGLRRCVALLVCGHRFGCQNAISPASGVETTLRHPAGPSRGSSSTGPPSPIAREYEFGVGTIASVESQLACTGTLVREALVSAVP
jgi:hypothetical protein